MSTVTVLMPVWRGERPDRFRLALRSATVEQTRAPDELILAVDGELTPELQDVVDKVTRGAYGPAQVVRSKQHQGIAETLQMGLLASTSEFVARADSDDHYRPERLAKQLKVITESHLDLVGCTMQEFSDAQSLGHGALRQRPLTHADIMAYLPKHTPFHHPTVVFRREVALAVGGYKELDRMEDYWLWQRMLAAGARSANVPEVLVDYRVDADLFARRGGLGLLRSDVFIQKVLLKDGMITRGRMARNLILRGGYRLCPVPLRRLGYRLFVEES
jgi:glycosyltransferase involved in cell wall biosynthesis